MTTITTKFLRTIWSKQPDMPHRFLSTKDWDTGDWVDHVSPFGGKDILQAGDLYFAPCGFTGPRRLRRDAVPGRWLYADLDEVTPDQAAERFLPPTIAWETSPGRYQCMWLLDRAVAPRTLEKLNQRATYLTGADKGGWSLTKVLRVPGSMSHKREEPFRVRLLFAGKTVHKVHDVAALLRDVEVGGVTPDRSPVPHVKDLPNPQVLYRKRRRKMSVRAKQLLNTSTVVSSDDRSARLWELENELLDNGLPAEEVLVLVRESVWNKYKGQRRELKVLWTEITKAQANRAGRPSRQRSARQRTKTKEKAKRTKTSRTDEAEFVSFRDFMTKSLPKASWLVEGIWSEGAHGMMAGEPKTFKTLLELDLAVSIASGTPFLNRFAVPRVGPVCVIQEENTPNDMQDRLMRIASSRGVGPTLTQEDGDTHLDFGQNLGIHLLNNQGFSLTDDEWMKWLETRVKRIRPALVTFDPLYLLAKGVDENSASEMTPILSNLLRLKQKYGCGIQIVHHYHKPKAEHKGRSAARMSGTGVFHRWLASAIYVERLDDTEPVIKISGEHRSHGSGGAYKVTFDLGTPDDLHYHAEVESWKEEDNVTGHDPKQELIDLVMMAAAEKKPATVQTLARELDITPNALRSRAKRAGLPLGEQRVAGRKQSIVIVPKSMQPQEEEEE